jgi:hypothetical protein
MCLRESDSCVSGAIFSWFLDIQPNMEAQGVIVFQYTVLYNPIITESFW